MTTLASWIPRHRLVAGPTPVTRLDSLSRELGIELWVKRDDLTGLLESGNKVRKLEFLLADALSAGADTLITCGTVQSNCCRTVAAVAARLGMQAILALNGPPCSVPDGNLLLDHLLGADVRYLNGHEWAELPAVLAVLADEARARGRVPYVIPESGATVLGALGYLACGEELAEQVRAGLPEFETIAITAFTGGSQAGLLMAQQLTGLRAAIVGIPIARGASAIRDYVREVLAEAARQYRLPVAVPRAIEVLDGYQAGGREAVSPAALDTMLDVAKREAIILDPVYTGKAFAGLLDTLRVDRRAFGARVCFVHTGGAFSIFPYRQELAARGLGRASSESLPSLLGR